MVPMVYTAWTSPDRETAANSGNCMPTAMIFTYTVVSASYAQIAINWAEIASKLKVDAPSFLFLCRFVNYRPRFRPRLMKKQCLAKKWHEKTVLDSTSKWRFLEILSLFISRGLNLGLRVL